jgi:hypothetical protein
MLLPEVIPAAPRPQRTPARRKARQLAKYLRAEWPDYTYLKALDLVRRYQQCNWIGVASGWARGVRVSQLGVSR